MGRAFAPVREWLVAHVLYGEEGATVKCTVPLELMENVPTAVGVTPGDRRYSTRVDVLAVMPLGPLASIVGLKNENDKFAPAPVAFAPPGW